MRIASAARRRPSRKLSTPESYPARIDGWRIDFEYTGQLVIFYRIGPRNGYAGYWPEEFGCDIADSRIPVDSRRSERVVREYLGDPPKKPGKHGAFHKSAYSYFVRDDALPLLSVAARASIVVSPTKIIGRENEPFSQVWVTNYVNCLDVKATIAAPPLNKLPGGMGVIKKPIFDETRWDGSELFVVPQEEGFFPYCSESFVMKWKAAQFKGMMFTRFLFDPDAVLC